MLGAITGDIIGFPYEHAPVKTTDFPLWRLGSRFTDGAVLTIAVADALLNGREHTAAFRCYHDRYLDAGYGGSFRQWARSPNLRPQAAGVQAMNPHYSSAIFQGDPLPYGWPERFAIITACNPNGQTVEDAQNARLDAQLAGCLRALGFEHRRMTGGSPDLSHAEPGYAVSAPLPDAIALGRKFKQDAIFWVDANSLKLVCCKEGGQTDLGPWLERLARGNALPRKTVLPSGSVELIEPQLDERIRQRRSTKNIKPARGSDH